MFNFWLVWRYLKSNKIFFAPTTLLGIVGMILAVASLVVAMAVVSGFQSTLKKSVIESVGHVLVMKRGVKGDDSFDMIEEIKPHAKGLVASTPFVYLEGILAHKKTLSGVVIQGIDPQSVQNVLNIHEKVTSGKFEFVKKDGLWGALVGEEVAKKFNLKVGDVFKVVMPISDGYESSSFKPNLGKFWVAGIMNLGRFDWNSRFIMTHLKGAQEFGKIGNNVMGFRLKLDSDNAAAQVSYEIGSNLGPSYWTRNWQDVNRNIFEAAKLEKIVIFFVLLIMVIAASFNISSTLFISVLRRFSDISILKTMGANRWFILKIFSFQGVLIGVIGSILGLIVGVGMCYGFLWAQDYWQLIPGEVYKLNRVELDFRMLDFVAIFIVSVLICLLATLAPSIRGSKLKPIEGLRYD